MKALIIEEEDAYTIQCLELDIAAQGKTIEEACRAFRETMQVEFSLEIGRAPIGEAPEFYHNQFKNNAEKIDLGAELPEVDEARITKAVYNVVTNRSKKAMAHFTDELYGKINLKERYAEVLKWMYENDTEKMNTLTREEMNALDVQFKLEVLKRLERLEAMLREES